MAHSEPSRSGAGASARETSVITTTLNMEGPDGVAGFSAALTLWKDINLVDLQKTLDAQGLEIVENQKENVIGRKKLAEQTREFKKISDEEKVNAFKGLLKAYQAEIDNLTKRSKVAESAFLNVYKVLADAPDPYPLLDAAVDQTARASEARLLEAELARERKEVTSLKSQLADAHLVEKERKKLAEKCETFEAKLEDLVNDRVAAKESELNAIYDERIRNYEDRERDLTSQVTVAREQLKELRTSNEFTHAKLFDHSQRQDHETMSRLAEMDVLTADLARATSRIADMERRNEKLRAEMEAVRSGSESSAKINSLESQISDLQKETSQLIHNLDMQSTDLQREREASKKKEAEKEALIESQAKEISSLQQKLAQFSDYDEIKRELDIMKYIEFAGTSLDDNQEEAGNDLFSTPDPMLRMPDPNADKSRSRGKPLENLLLAKNRKMQEQLTTLRVAHEELQTNKQELQQRVNSLQAQLDEQKALNERLENDLSRLNGASPANHVELPHSASSSSLKQDGLYSLKLGRGRNVQDGQAVAPPGLTMTAENSILPIITSQRDRFRARNAELEDEIRKQQGAMQELRNEIKAFQADNVKLYEKVRYLQSYRDDAGSASTSKSLYPPLAGKEKDATQKKYKSLYEQSMNPFEAFRGRERTSAVQSLNPLEKILLGMTNLILGHRALRAAFVVYAVGLHLFVFFMLWEYTASGNATTAVDLDRIQ